MADDESTQDTPRAPAPEAGEAPTTGELDEDRSTFVGRIKDAWKDTVGTYATEEGETKTLLARLVDFGHLSRDESMRVFGDVKGRIEQNRKELDRRVDESIKRATSRMTVPGSGDVKALHEQVDELEARIQSLEARRG